MAISIVFKQEKRFKEKFFAWPHHGLDGAPAESVGGELYTMKRTLYNGAYNFDVPYANFNSTMEIFPLSVLFTTKLMVASDTTIAARSREWRLLAVVDSGG